MKKNIIILLLFALTGCSGYVEETNKKEPERTKKIVITKEPEKGQNITIAGNGNYYVGTDIKPGRYDIGLIEGEGTIMCCDKGGFLASLDKEHKTYKNIDLIKDQKIEVFGVKIKLIAK